MYLCWLMIQPFIGVLMWATVLAIVFYPVHKRIHSRIKSPGWSALLSSLLVIVTILLPLTLIAAAVVNETSGVAQTLPGTIKSLLDPNSPTTGRYLQWLGRYVNLEQVLSPDYLMERLRGLSGMLAQRSLGFIGNVVGFVVEIFFIIFTLYYLFRDGDQIRAALHDLLPLEQAQSHEIFTRTRDVISASVYGVLVIAAIQGALGGLAFWFLGLPSPLLWGVVMVFMSMIPVLGAFIVWIPAALYLVATGDWGEAIILAVWGTLVIGSVDNFLRPKLVGDKTRLHELLIFFSVLGGLQVFGLLGLVLGPVVVAITLALLDVVRQADRPTQQTQQEPDLIEQQAAVRTIEAES